MNIWEILYHNYFVFFSVVIIFSWIGVSTYKSIVKINNAFKPVAILCGFSLLLYASAKTGQATVIGPDLFRWYAADIGFGLAFLTLGVFSGMRKYNFSRMSAFVWVATCGACIHEMIQITANNKGMKNLGLISENMTGRGDYSDFIIYLITLVVSLMALYNSKKNARKSYVEYLSTLAGAEKKKALDNSKEIRKNLGIN
jgi:hypothetical protein